MTQPLPQALAAYFAAKNRQDIDTALASFVETATVKDEAKERRGLAEIREWMEKTRHDYNDTAEVQGVVRDDQTYTVTALVSGTFPGSPVSLDFRFTLVEGRISHLEIG